MEKQRVPLSQAAAELGMAPQGVREYMKKGLLDIGEVLPTIQNRTERKKYNYHIYRDKLDRHLGKGVSNEEVV